MVEVTIVVAILAMAAAVVLPALSNIGRAELRSSAAKLAGTIRATYDAAALNGVPQRLVFVFDKHVVKVEEGSAGGPSGSGLADMAALLSGGLAPPSVDIGPEDAEGEVPKEVEPPREIMSLLGLNPEGDDDEEGGGTLGIAKFHSAGHDLELGEEVRLLDIWVEGMSQPLREGKAFLDFYPHGYTERAFIHLTNEAGDVFTIEVAPLTGKTEIHNEYIEAPK